MDTRLNKKGDTRGLPPPPPQTFFPSGKSNRRGEGGRFATGKKIVGRGWGLPSGNVFIALV